MPVMTLEQARSMVDGALAKARELNIAISVAVADPGGHVRMLARMDERFFTAEMAMVKAYTAAAFARDTELLEERFAHRQLLAGAFTPISQGKVAIAMGGVVVRQDGEIVATIGASGGTGEEDVACAKAGAACFR